MPTKELSDIEIWRKNTDGLSWGDTQLCQIPALLSMQEYSDQSNSQLIKENEELRHALELCKRFKGIAEKRIYDNYCATVSIESEREMNSILTKELSEKDTTIKELKEALELWQTFDTRIHTGLDAAKFYLKAKAALNK